MLQISIRHYSRLSGTGARIESDVAVDVKSKSL
jgi:hypothetical protein